MNGSVKIINKLIKKFWKVKDSITPKKPAKQKTYEYWAAKKYNSSPEISFVIQCHNKSNPVINIANKLRKYNNSEIIVIDDGSDEQHSIALLNSLKFGNDFILRANDLYEIVTYDRAIYLARGKYVILLQDDDDFDDLKWVDEGLEYFAKYPDMVILGGRDGINLLPYDTTADGKRGDFIVEGKIAYRKNSFKLDLAGTSGKINTFKFVEFVTRAPMWVKRDLFIDKLKHIDQSFAPFQWDDTEICLRAWISGLSVGWYRAKFNTGDQGTGGMRIWNKELHNRQDEVNAKKVYEMYGDKLDCISSLVETANKERLRES